MKSLKSLQTSSSIQLAAVSNLRVKRSQAARSPQAPQALPHPHRARAPRRSWFGHPKCSPRRSWHGHPKCSPRRPWSGHPKCSPSQAVPQPRNPQLSPAAALGVQCSRQPCHGTAVPGTLRSTAFAQVKHHLHVFDWSRFTKINFKL